MNNKDQVALLVGQAAADRLEILGLIRADREHLPKPEVWRLTVRLGAQEPQFVTGLRCELADMVHTFNAHRGRSVHSAPTWRHGHRPRTSFTDTYAREASAKSQMTLALRAGLDARIEPCVIVPIKNWS